jgi:hypothetical protein
MALVLTLFAGCASDPAEDDINNYFQNEMVNVIELETSVTSSFNSAVEENYVDDATLLVKLKEEVVPNSNQLIEAAQAVVTETEELGAIHAKYVESKMTQNEGLVMLLNVIENDLGTEMATQANDLLLASQAQLEIYDTELFAFAGEHGIEME